MKSRSAVLVTASVVITLALPANFVAQTVLADELSASHHVALLAFATFILVFLMTGIPRREELRALGRYGALRAAAAGILGVYASQQLVLANRYTDAPPGSEVLFFTTAAWGVIVVLASLVVPKNRPTALQVLLSGVALLGAAGILANWERPSSFSPFVRYPTEHVAMLLAGAAWAGFTLLIAPLGRQHRWRALLPLATAAAAIASAVPLLIDPLRGDIVGEALSVAPQLLVATTTFAAIVISWSWLVSTTDTVRPASLLFLPPVSLTILGVFEREVGAFGPSPLLWNVVWWACAVTVAGALGVALLGRASLLGRHVDGVSGTGEGGRRPTRDVARVLAYVALILSTTAVVAALVAVRAPAFAANVVGIRGDGSAYAASWTMPGAETVGDVLVVLASLAALVGAVGFIRSQWREIALLELAAILLVALLAVPILVRTPLRTWTRWIPGEVQQDYGTEYARLTLEPTDGTASRVAVAGSVAAVGLLATASALRVIRRRRSTPTALTPGANDESESGT